MALFSFAPSAHAAETSFWSGMSFYQKEAYANRVMAERACLTYNVNKEIFVAADRSVNVRDPGWWLFNDDHAVGVGWQTSTADKGTLKCSGLLRSSLLADTGYEGKNGQLLIDLGFKQGNPPGGSYTLNPDGAPERAALAGAFDQIIKTKQA
ncbi:hypothetical protein [Propioniciclava tarda]|uniref:Uncharacterized protein n=1 Tax=Propioniciclava tarda TaxID=433330 RepID=A0A4Q9KNE7_PROTD|nr:hypothetical protein [Propioniciclava tarda]TBT96116.1 hypothetical protein ET996_00095 [Propioniciclava tarda]